MKLSAIIEQERRRLEALYPGQSIGDGTVLSEGRAPLIRFTVGDQIITVRPRDPERQRAAARAILRDIARRNPRVKGIDVVKVLREQHDRRP